MGDRANVYVHEGDEPDVYLYTHWSGYNLPETVRTALQRGAGRWNDPQYLTRIVFCEMIGDDTQSTTGFGISAFVGDGDDRIVDVDTKGGTVTLTAYGAESAAVPIAEYVAAPSATWPDES
jgi:hypothetical protein